MLLREKFKRKTKTLYEAIECSDSIATIEAIERGENINKLGNCFTPLLLNTEIWNWHFCNFKNVEEAPFLEITEALFAAGADPNSYGGCGNRAPLHCVMSLQAVKCFISAGADVNIRTTHHQQTPLHNVIRGHPSRDGLQIVQALVNAGAKVNARNFFNKTPLHYAAESGDLKIVDYLLSVHADANVRCSAGLKPVDYTQATEIKSIFVSAAWVRGLRYFWIVACMSQ